MPFNTMLSLSASLFMTRRNRSPSSIPIMSTSVHDSMPLLQPKKEPANTSRDQPVPLGTRENVYGRTKIVDSRRESFAVRKDRPVANSLPSSIQAPYKRVWTLAITAPEGERLTVGTTSFDSLATYSLHLDISMRPSVGSATLLAAIHVNLTPSTLWPPMIKLTWIWTRAFKPLSRCIKCRHSRRFRRFSGLTDGGKSRNRCIKEGRTTQLLEGILSLYTSTQTSINILWNRDLNEYPETLAQILSTFIATANAAIVPFIELLTDWIRSDDPLESKNSIRIRQFTTIGLETPSWIHGLNWIRGSNINPFGSDPS
ncbi:MAG: hypothetical protein J3R72DRAFT_498338 [Linnemannia gamsii]|nr:MAG: hypothetical protein J3R72DRAFT_498338 [Linnemannia gamsii]